MAHKSFENFLIWKIKKGLGESILSLSGEPDFSENGSFTGYRRTIEKISDKDTNEQYINAIELLVVGIAHVDAEGKFIHVNKHLCSMLGYSHEELLQLTVREVSHPDDENITDDIRLKLYSGEIDSFKLEKRYLRKDNSSIWVGLTIVVNRGVDGKPLYGVSLVEDISARKKAEERVRYLANHDEMTDLPNRAYFSQLVTQTIKYSKRYKRAFGVLFIGLDRFKHINDSLGLDSGDQLIIQMAKRLKNCLRSSDLVARLGGDEFAILAHEVENKKDVVTVARNILSIAKKPFNIMGVECRVTVSVGICMFPAGSEDEQALMQNSNVALRHF